METSPRGSDRASYYEELLKAQEGSGLSVGAFAEVARVSCATLYSWRRRLRQGGRSKARPRLLEVQVSDGVAERSVSTVSSRPMTLVVSDRFRLELDTGFDEGAVARLLGVLARC